MIAASKRPLSALHRYTDHLNTEFGKNFVQRDSLQTQYLQQNKPLRLPRKKIPKKSYKSSTNVTIHQEKQHLYSETLTLKQKYHQVYDENIKLNTRILALEKELAKKNKIILSRNTEPIIINRESNTNLKQVQIASSLTTNLKALLHEQKVKYDKLNEQCEKLKRTVKYTKIIQLELQLKAFQQQTVRLKGILAEVNYTKLNQKQSYKKLTKLQKKFKSKQQENLALLEINLKYQSQIKQNQKQIRQQQEVNKNKQMKLLNDLKEVKKRLAINLKSRELIQSNIIKRNNSQRNEQRKYNSQKRHYKHSSNGNLFENAINSNSKQSNMIPNSSKRPLTASNKINRMQLNKEEKDPFTKTQNKSSSEYQNIYDYDDQFQQDQNQNYSPDFETQNNRQEQRNLYQKNKINTIIQQQESFNEFDQLCYLITYRFLAQNWNYNKFVQSINKNYSKDIKAKQIQEIVENQPFYLQETQSQFLIKYLFQVDEIKQVKLTNISDFLDLMKSVIYEYSPFSDSKIRDTRQVFVQQYLENRQKWIQFFKRKNGYVHHNDFHELLSNSGFVDEQTQQIIADLSLFIYDLTQFSMESIEKYINTLSEKNGKIKQTPPNEISIN